MRRYLSFHLRLWTRKEKEIAIVTHSGFLSHTLNTFGNDCHPLVKKEISKQWALSTSCLQPSCLWFASILANWTEYVQFLYTSLESWRLFCVKNLTPRSWYTFYNTFPVSALIFKKKNITCFVIILWYVGDFTLAVWCLRCSRMLCFFFMTNVSCYLL